MKKFLLFPIIIIIFIFSNIFAQESLQKGIDAFKAENFEKAKEILEKIVDDNDEIAEAQYYLGRSFLALGDYDEAVDHLEEAVDLNEDNAMYFLVLGQALGVKVRNASVFKQAFLASDIKNAFKKAVELDSTLLPAHLSLANFYAAAPGIMGGDVNLAYKHAKIVIDMGEPRGYFILAQIHQKNEQPDSALAVYSELEKTYGNDPKYFNIFNSYGYLLLNMKKYEQAIEKFKKQVELAPDRANSYDSLGDGYRAAGRIEEAKQSYLKALEIDPEFEASKNNLKELEK